VKDLITLKYKAIQEVKYLQIDMEMPLWDVIKSLALIKFERNLLSPNKILYEQQKS
jgi:hypothetical protein